MMWLATGFTSFIVSYVFRSSCEELFGHHSHSYTYCSARLMNTNTEPGCASLVCTLQSILGASKNQKSQTLPY